MAKKSDAIRQFLNTLAKSDKSTVLSTISTVLRKYQTTKEASPKKSDIVKLKAALSRLETFRCSASDQKIMDSAVTTITYIQLLLLEKASSISQLEKMQESLKRLDDLVLGLVKKNNDLQNQSDQLTTVVGYLKESRQSLSEVTQLLHSTPTKLNDLQRLTSLEFNQFKKLFLNSSNNIESLSSSVERLGDSFSEEINHLFNRKLKSRQVFYFILILYFFVSLLPIYWLSKKDYGYAELSKNLSSTIQDNHSENQKSINRILADTGSWTKEKQDQWARLISLGESNNKRTLELGLQLENFTKTWAEHQKTDPNLNPNNSITMRKHPILVVHFHTDFSELNLEKLGDYRAAFSKETSGRLAGSKPAGLFAVVGNRVNPLVFLKGTSIPETAWVLPDLPPRTIPSSISTVFQSLEEYSSDIKPGEKDLLLIVSPEVEVPGESLLEKFGNINVLYCNPVGDVKSPEAVVNSKIKWLNITDKKRGSFFQFQEPEKSAEKGKSVFFRDLIRKGINGF